MKTQEPDAGVLPHLTPRGTDAFETFVSEHSDVLRPPERPYHLVSEVLAGRPILTVVVSVYNKAQFVERCLDSIADLSIGRELVELIVVDDCSTDASRQIVRGKMSQFPNHQLIEMDENTGGPAIPRNVGISRARGKYLTIVDADDWLSVDGMGVLVALLEESGDNYAAGKTLVVEDAGMRTVGEYYSNATRRNAAIASIPPVFHHLAPPGRIMRTSFIRSRGICFPHLKFSEDTIFYMEVLLAAETISTTENVVYYANRLSENSGSLVGQTSIFEKMEAKELTLNYILARGLDVSRERQVLGRIFDLDYVSRVLRRRRFLASDDDQRFYALFEPLFAAEARLRYPVRDLFQSELNYQIYLLCRRREYGLLRTLVEWSLSGAHEQYFDARSGRFYEITPTGIPDFVVPLKAIATLVSERDGRLHIELVVYGDFDVVDSIQCIDRRRPEVRWNLPMTERRGDTMAFEGCVGEARALLSGRAIMVLVYDGYKRCSIDAAPIGSESVYLTVNKRLGFR